MHFPTTPMRDRHDGMAAVAAEINDVTRLVESFGEAVRQRHPSMYLSRMVSATMPCSGTHVSVEPARGEKCSQCVCVGCMVCVVCVVCAWRKGMGAWVYASGM